MSFRAAVLVGGQSRRMGQPKATIRIGDKPLAARVAQAANLAGATRTFAVGASFEPSELGIEDVVPDQFPGQGPLGAIVTALSASGADGTNAVTIVLACDLISPQPDAIAAVVGALGSADVAVPVVDGYRQWLHAAWSPSAAAALHESFLNGERAPRNAVRRLDVIEVAGLSASAFADADTPDQLPAEI